MPRYYKNSLNVEERLAELRAVADEEQASMIDEKLAKICEWRKQGYEPMILTRLGSNIFYKVRGADAFRVHQESAYAYNTTRYGDAYEYVNWIVCKPTGIKDAVGREVYDLPDGKKFVIDSWPGSAEAFGGTNIVPPKIL